MTKEKNGYSYRHYLISMKQQENDFRVNVTITIDEKNKKLKNIQVLKQ